MSNAVAEVLNNAGYPAEHLDGDVIRQRLWSDLDFSKKGREVNVSRIAFIASLLTRNGAIALVSLVSPYRKMRDEARRQIGSFIEIYVRCPLEICEKRDVKGMYRLACEGKIKNFTGISDAYEEPQSPEIIVDTHLLDVDSCVNKIMGYVTANKLNAYSPNP